MMAYNLRHCVILVMCYFALTDSALMRNKRQDFVFPDDNQPDGIPPWIFQGNHLNQPPPPENPPQNEGSWYPPIFVPVTSKSPTRSTPTTRSSSIRPARTTQPPAFFDCMRRCPATNEYNPICGTNLQLYFNEQKFKCAQSCGAVVEIARRGNCRGLL